MVYLRRVLKRRPASLTEEEWLRCWQARRSEASYGAASWILTPVSALPDVLCPSCRTYHQQGQEHVCMCPLPTQADRERLRLSSSAIATPGQLLSPFPELLAFLCKTSLEGGISRQPGKLSLVCESGMWKVTLNDETTGLYASLTGQGLDDLFLTIEERLERSEMPWRVSNFTPKGRRAKG